MVGNGWYFQSEIVAFIGGKRIGLSYVWHNGTVIATGSALDYNSYTYHGYNNWNGGYISGEGRCMCLVGIRSVYQPYKYTWKWSDVLCEAAHYFICEYHGERIMSVNSSLLPKIGSPLTITGNISQLYIETLQVSVLRNGISTLLVHSLRGNGFSHTTSNISLMDNGLFRFTATNNLGNCSVSKDLYLAVGNISLTLSETSPLILSVFNQTSVNCTCSGFYQPDCLWFRNNLEVEQRPGFDVTQVNTTQKHGTIGHSQLFVRISDARIGGKYECRARNWYAEGGSTNLTVLVSASSPTFKQHQDLENYNSLTLTTCTSQGYPRPYITWLRNGTPVSSQVFSIQNNKVTTTLRFRLVSVLDGGLYTCRIAANSAGSEITRELNITVQPNVLLSTTSIITTYGSKITVSCISFAHPMPTVTWLRRGRIVSLNFQDSVYQTTRYENSLMKITAHLHIPVADVYFTGKYYCNSTNDHKKFHSAAFEFQVPANISLLTTVAWTVPLTNEKIFVDCESYGFPLPSVSWSKHLKSVTDNNNTLIYQEKTKTSSYSLKSRLFVFYHTIEQVGRYTCTANNINSSYSVVTSYQVQARTNISMVNQTVYSKYKERVEVNCTAFGFPTPNIYWTRQKEKVSFDKSKEVHQIVVNVIEYEVVTTLVISSSLPEYAGLYTCHTSNTVAILDEIKLRRNLQFDVVPFFVKSSAYERFNQTQVLSCQFNTKPSSKFYWSLNGTLFNHSNLTSPTNVINTKTNNTMTSQLYIQAAVIFGSDAKVKCWAENEAGISEQKSILINKDLIFDNGEFYVQYGIIRQIISAHQFCKKQGGYLPTAAYIEESQLKNSTKTSFWVLPNGTEPVITASSLCLTVQNRKLVAVECDGALSVLCIFPVVRLNNASQCHHDEVVVNWSDQTRFEDQIFFQLMAESRENMQISLQNYTQSFQSEHKYENSFRLPANQQFDIKVKLFPDFWKIPISPSILGKTVMSPSGECTARENTVLVVGATVPSILLLVLVSAAIAFHFRRKTTSSQVDDDGHRQAHESRPETGDLHANTSFTIPADADSFDGSIVENPYDEPSFLTLENTYEQPIRASKATLFQ